MRSGDTSSCWQTLHFCVNMTRATTTTTTKHVPTRHEETPLDHALTHFLPMKHYTQAPLWWSSRQWWWCSVILEKGACSPDVINLINRTANRLWCCMWYWRISDLTNEFINRVIIYKFWRQGSVCLDLNSFCYFKDISTCLNNNILWQKMSKFSKISL